MKTLFIHHNGSKLAAIKFGEGAKHLLCFHGYGLDKNSFLQFEQKLGKEYTLYAFDLFAHGKSEYGHDERALELSDWKVFIETFLEQEQIRRFSIMAFSMGGKIALCTYELFYGQIDRMTLIAPDGIKTSFWYSIATYPGILNKFFRYTIFHPHFYFRAIKIFEFLRLADKGILKFADNEMNTAQKRARVYYSWMIYKNFKPNLKNILEIAEKKNTSFLYITGAYDKIIKTEYIVAFIKKMKFAKHVEMGCGHTSLLKYVYKAFDFIPLTI